MPPTKVSYRIRASGKTVTEAIEGEKALRWAYENPLGRVLFRALVATRLPSCLYGLWQNTPASAKAIPAFIARHALDPQEFETPPKGWPHFNAFFERRLKAEARPIDPDPSRLVSPGDGKALLLPLSLGTTIPAKGVAFQLAQLLGGEEAARPFQDGDALILRLAPYDYHRFHFPASGIAGPSVSIPGAYDSVNPIALAAQPGLLGRNARQVCMLEGSIFGPIAMVEVGAFNVASIHQSHRPGPVMRGAEKGSFRFGGSTVILVVGPKRVQWDADLCAASAEGIELALKMGEGLGRPIP